MHPIIAFYLGDERLTKTLGFGVKNFLSPPTPEWHQWVEGCHNHIQWAFPLTEPSNYNPNAPLLDMDTILSFRNSIVLRDVLSDVFESMLEFYGFVFNSYGGAGHLIKCAYPQYNLSDYPWVKPCDHNFLRITRILKCLRLLGHAYLAVEFYKALNDMYTREAFRDIIGPTTFQFWTDAAFNDALVTPTADEFGFRYDKTA